MKPLVLLRAPILTLSGYGTHARQIGEWLMRLVNADSIELYCEPLQWGITTWITNIDRDPLVNALMMRCKKVPRQPDVSFQLQLPNEWDPQLATVNVGVTAAVETDRAVSEWAKSCDAMNHVVVPSQHSMKSLLAAGWKPRDGAAHVIGESFPNALLNANVTTTALDPLRPFTFLLFGQMTGQDNARVDRKNLHNTIRWMLEEFAGDEDVGILLKTNQGRSTVFDTYHTENIVRLIVKSVAAKTSRKLPELQLVHGDLNDDDVAALYRHSNVKALVSATRGEGFGLPLLEAAACDLPVIATGWSAHTEFLGLGRYVDLPCTLQPIPKERVDNIFPAGAKWAEVSEDDFKRRVRKFHTSSSIPREWARDLGVKIRANYSQDAIAAAWSATFENMLRKVSG